MRAASFSWCSVSARRPMSSVICCWSSGLSALAMLCVEEERGPSHGEVVTTTKRSTIDGAESRMRSRRGNKKEKRVEEEEERRREE